MYIVFHMYSNLNIQIVVKAQNAILPTPPKNIVPRGVTQVYA